MLDSCKSHKLEQSGERVKTQQGGEHQHVFIIVLDT